jgi:hypothetical protein
MEGNHSMHVSNGEKHLVRNPEVKRAFGRYIRRHKNDTWSTENNARISDTCSSGMKTDTIMVKFADCIQQLKQFYLHRSGKVVVCETLHNEHQLLLCIHPTYSPHVAWSAVTCPL